MTDSLKEKSSPRYKLRNRDFENIIYIVENKLLEKQGKGIYTLVEDLINEVERLRAICQLVLIEENDRIAKLWNEPARR
jgi:hypothetical protein